ncbi:hypothetical protein [Phenylobacterium ferrooxidans]|uniref:Uncharacterized protein n=1 Tax=Phenylobacterium ferrooxidans TaxID=2982689 RepID=A0ABW6CM62_9CAUL
MTKIDDGANAPEEPVSAVDEMVSPTLLPHAPELIRRGDLVKIAALPALYAVSRLAWWGFMAIAEPERIAGLTGEGKAIFLAFTFGGALALLWVCSRLVASPRSATGLILLAAGCFLAFDLGGFLHRAGGRYWLTASVFLTLAGLEAALAARKLGPPSGPSHRVRTWGAPIVACFGVCFVLCVGFASYFFRAAAPSALAVNTTSPVPTVSQEPTAGPAPGPPVTTVVQIPASARDALFQLAYGAAAPAPVLIGNGAYQAHPEFAVLVADHTFALVSLAEIPAEEAAEGQPAVVAVHYFGQGSDGTPQSIGAWPALVSSGSGGTTSGLKLRADLLAFPVVEVTGGFYLQGCGASTTDLIVLTPNGPITTSYLSAYSGEGERDRLATTLTRVDDQTLEVSYSGVFSGRLRLNFNGSEFAKEGIRDDDLPSC